ncbi:MAG: sigma-54 dependent transcriptional regulator [Myxococcales bacterium]|nr:sigma-54 dependent transcriptional regulator [Myxococcales bacterium]
MPNSKRLLLVDDDRAMRELLASLFTEEGHVVTEATSAEEAIASLEDDEFDVVLSDIRMPGRSGIEMVADVKRLRPGTPVVLMTAFGSVDSAVEAIRAGAYDYITKPFEPDAVQFAVERALEHRALECENQSLRRAVDKTANLGDLIGASPAMRDIFALIRKLAHNRSSVLITGESGTGKEVIARTIHFHGSRADAPFVPINCTAIPEGLLESELFGHVRGAFTGAHTTKQGLFEKANGGTLFLDEIGDMGAGVQSKLLRVLQDREVRPVGGTKSVHVDVRIIAATNQDLEAEMRASRFREDLYYRLNVIPIHVPPLRERPEDIPALAETFLKRHGDGTSYKLSPEALRALKGQTWRGNGRELENAIERAIALAEGTEIQLSDLPHAQDSAGDRSTSAFLRTSAERELTLREVEELYIEEILNRQNGNKVRSARILGIDRKTLYRRAERAARSGSDATAQPPTPAEARKEAT